MWQLRIEKVGQSSRARWVWCWYTAPAAMKRLRTVLAWRSRARVTDSASALRKRSVVVRSVALLAAAVGMSAVTVWSCGGTTGREDIPGAPSGMTGGGTTGVDASVVDGDAGASEDATVVDSELPTWDVAIMYADAERLPEVVAVPPSTVGDAAAGGADAGPPPMPGDDWPVCAPVQTDSLEPDGSLAVTPGSGTCFVSDDGGACSSRVWSNSPICDWCILNFGGAEFNGATFPPCSDLRDAGVAMMASGPAVGHSLFSLCADFYNCAIGVGIASGHVELLTYMLCGDAGADNCDAPGVAAPCRAQVQAAYETTQSATILEHPTKWVPGNGVGPAGPEAFTLLNAIGSGGCDPYCFSDASPETACGWATPYACSCLDPSSGYANPLVYADGGVPPGCVAPQ